MRCAWLCAEVGGIERVGVAVEKVAIAVAE
jgi:hypothetical protein